MIAVPNAIPVTPPLVPTVAIVALLLLQLPPPVADANTEVNPRQIFPEPVIAAGRACTVSKVADLQPVLSVYVMPAVPAAAPTTNPEELPSSATAVLPLVQEPPAGAQMNVDDKP
jgi:hypothetical protein